MQTIINTIFYNNNNKKNNNKLVKSIIYNLKYIYILYKHKLNKLILI